MRPETTFEQVLTTMEAALSNVHLVSKPFPHFAIPDLFDAETASAVLTWLEDDVPWAVQSRSFYVHHGCTELTERAAGSPAAVISAPETLQCIRKHLERIFGIRLSSSHFELAAHRMLPGHRIGIHNDTPAYGTETHRLLINLNSGFEDEQGGHLVLLDLHDPATSAVIVRPLHNSAVAMEFSDHSWHCVDEIKSGKRYSLVYSFWIENAVTNEAHTSESLQDEAKEITEQELGAIMSLLRELGADAVPHSSRSLMDHLNGTYQILKQWQCESDVCKAALFHNVLGTPAFPHPITENCLAKVRELIGERALILIRIFNRLDLPALRGIVSGEKISDSGGTVVLSVNDKRALVCLVWANVLEQSHYLQYSNEGIAELKHFFRETSHLLPRQARENIRTLLSISPGR